MTNPNIEKVFCLLDEWRHLPAYQLERRADIYFGLFLRDVLDDYLRPKGLTVHPTLIPEFPLRQKTSNRSDKVDYFALATHTETGDQVAFLVELKTDIKSQRDEQKEYLTRAKKRGMRKILFDLKLIFKATSADLRGKYFHLFEAVEKLGLVNKLPNELSERVYGDQPRGLRKCIKDIEIAPSLPTIDVLYVLPKDNEHMHCIGFERVAAVAESQGEIGQCFAAYLRKWGCDEYKAGSQRR